MNSKPIEGCKKKTAPVASTTEAVSPAEAGKQVCIENDIMIPEKTQEQDAPPYLDDDGIPVCPYVHRGDEVDLDAPSAVLKAETAPAGGERPTMPPGVILYADDTKALLEMAENIRFLAGQTQIAIINVNLGMAGVDSERLLHRIDEMTGILRRLIGK